MRPRVKVFIIALLIGMAWLWAKTPPRMGPQHQQVTPINNLLQTLYNANNEEWFNRELQSTAFVSVKLGPADGAIGITKTCNGGLCIEINPKLNVTGKQVAMTLLHEQCHVKVYPWKKKDEHDGAWQVCMHHLADQGAFDRLW